MQGIGNRLVPSMLAAGANRKIVRVFCEKEVCNPYGFFMPAASFFLYLSPLSSLLQKVSFEELTLNLFSV